MTSEELVTLSSDKFGNLSPKQIAVVMMIADPEFRYNLKNEGKSEAMPMLSTGDISDLRNFPDSVLNDLTNHYRAGLALGKETPGSQTVQCLPAFVAGLAVGYAAYAYAKKY
jgi:hypothetical protein